MVMKLGMSTRLALWIVLGISNPLLSQSPEKIHDSPPRPVYDLTPRGAAGRAAATAAPAGSQAFRAQQVGEQIELNWRGASSLIASYIVVEHSTDGQQFHAIGRLAGDEPSAPQVYAFTDNRARPGTNYYRLRRVSASGLTEFSPVQKVVAIVGQATNLQLRPELTSRGLPLPATVGEVLIYDGRGQQIARTQLASDGSTIDISDLPRGQYWLAVRTPSGTLQTGNFVK